MKSEGLSHDSFLIERVYPNCRDHVWAAWSDPDKKRAWFGDGLTEIDFCEGGVQRGSFKNHMGDHSNETTFFEITDRERIVFAYSMAMNGVIHSVSLVTVVFEDQGGGTLLRYFEQMCIIPPSDGVEGRRQGWQALLDSLEDFLATDTRSREAG